MPTTDPTRRPITFWLPREMKDQLTATAKADGVPVSLRLRQLIAAYLEARERAGG